MQFEQDYRKLAGLVGLQGYDDPKQDIRLIVKNWFESQESGDWIIVLDNADNRLDFFPELQSADENTNSDGLAALIPQGSKGMVIITTRDREVADQLADMNVLSKELMKPEEAKRLFQMQYPNAAVWNHDESILLLLKELQYLPLAIVHAASYLRLNPLSSPSIYLKQYTSTRDEQKRLLSKPYNLRRDSNAETVLATFLITFRQVQEQVPLASSLLKLMGCIDRHGIPRELLASSGLNNSDDEIALSLALSKLINFSLLIDAVDGRVYEIHSLIHLSIEVSLSQSVSEKDAAVQSAANALVRVLPNGLKSEDWSMWRVYFPHASALLINAKTKSLYLARISLYMTRFLLAVGRYNEAEHSAQRSVELFTSLRGDDDLETLLSNHELAWTYDRLGRTIEAENLFVKLLEKCKRVLGKEHLSTLGVMGTLAWVYQTQGRLKEAEDLLVHVIEKDKRILGEEHPDTLTSMSKLAWTYYRQGRRKEAENLGMQVFEKQKKVLGEEHLDTLISMWNLASTYDNQGRWKEAEDLGMQVFEKQKKVLGEEHPDTLTSMSKLAWTYYRQGRWKEAENLGMQVFEKRKKVLGEEHPDILSSIFILKSLKRHCWRRRWGFGRCS
jgi:tetratricopeptide (TPR) repeat protein